MVGGGDFGGEPDHPKIRTGQHLRAALGVGAHDDSLFGRVRAGFVENGIGNGDLADVVQRCRVAQLVGLAFIQPQPACQIVREQANPFDVVGGFLRTGFHRAGEQVDHLQLRFHQVLVQVQVLEGDADIGAEHLDQVQLHVRQLGRAGDEQQVFRIARVGEIQDVMIGLEDMVLAVVGGMEAVQHLVRQAGFDRIADVGREVAGGGGDPDWRNGRVVGFRHRAIQRAVLQAGQRGQLGQDGGGEFVTLVARVDLGRGFRHPLQPVPRRIDHRKIAITAQGHVHRGFELARGELGLFLVVIDVVGADHLALRRLPRMAGAQHDADQTIAELLAYTPDQIQAGVLGLHDDIDDHQRDVWIGLQAFKTLAAGGGFQDLEVLSFELHILQHDAGDFADFRFVIDDQHLPVCVAAHAWFNPARKPWAWKAWACCRARRARWHRPRAAGGW